MGVSEDKTLPFSTPTKTCSKLTSSVEAKENRLTSPNISTQKKHSSKRFMSPTISAASKAVTPRKKILAERNSDATDPSCVTNNVVCSHLQRSQSFDLKQGSVDTGGGSVYSSAGSWSSRVSEVGSVGGGEDGAEVKPYDPVYNYLSPRPKYLLYNPNRRNEILNLNDMVDCVSSESENSTESEESLVKTNKEVDERVGESVEQADLKVEEYVVQADLKVEKVGEVEEKEDGVTGQVALKAVESVDQAEGGDVVAAVDEKIDELVDEAEAEKVLGISQHSVTLAEPLKYLELVNEAGDSGSEALMTESDGEETQASIEIEEDEEESGEFDEEYEGQSGWTPRGVLKTWFVIVLLGLSTLYISSMNSPSWGVADEYWRTQHDLLGAPSTDVYENASGFVIQSDLTQMALAEASHRIMDDIFAGGDDSDVAVSCEELDGLSCEASDVADLGQMADDIVTEVLITDVTDVAEDVDRGMEDLSLAEDVGDIVYDQWIHVEDMTPAGSIQSAEGYGEVIEPHTAVVYSDAPLNELHTADDQFETTMVDPVMNENADAQLDELSTADEQLKTTLTAAVVDEDSTGEASEELELAEPETIIPEDETLNNLEQAGATEQATSDSLVDKLTTLYSKETDKTVVFSVLSALLLGILGFLGFRKMKKTAKPPTEFTVVSEQVDANIGHHQVKQASYSRPAAEPEVSLSHSFMSGLGTPTVALLGELTVGEQEASSFYRRTCQSEHNHDETTYSFSQRNMTPPASGFPSTTESPPHASYTSQRRSKVELPTSSIDSPSYGSFTTEMILKREEAARGGEKVIVTPVRRSSRIRGRGTPIAS